MRTIEKNRKQKDSNLPISIKFLVKIVLIVIGFMVWGSGFVWVLLGLYLGLSIIKYVLSCLISLAVLIVSILLLIQFIF